MPSILSAFLSGEALANSSFVLSKEYVELRLDGVVRELGISMPFDNEDLDRFVVWSVRPPTSAESSIREIRDQRTGRALGHVFPITSLSPRSPFSAERLENRFQQIFASVAVKSIVTDGTANHAVIRRLEELADHAALSDLFDDDLAVVVLGKQNVEVSEASVDDIRLQLQGRGFFLDDLAEEYNWTRVRPDLGDGSCTVGRISSDLTDHTGLFSELVCLASRQSSAPASVLVYYQIIEVLADKLLGARLSRLVVNPPSDSWELKEALGKAVSEKSRVVSMCTQAATGPNAAIFVYLRDLGVNFLRACNVEAEDQADPGSILYAVRNTVVHNQSALNAEAHRHLTRFVDAFHDAVFCIVRNFSAETAS